VKAAARPVAYEHDDPPPRQRSLALAPQPAAVPLPATRGQCVGPGACPKIACRQSTVAEVSPTGGIVLFHGGLGRPYVRPTNGNAAATDPFDEHVIARIELARYTCVLDFVDAHPDGADRETVAAELGLGPEAVRVEEERAVAKIRSTPAGRDLWAAMTGAPPDEDAQIADMARGAARLARRGADLDPSDLGNEEARRVARDMLVEVNAALGVLRRRRDRRRP